MTIETLFGPETMKPRTIRFKIIRPVFETLVIKEEYQLPEDRHQIHLSRAGIQDIHFPPEGNQGIFLYCSSGRDQYL
jgi:hypothetical protein